MSEPRRRHNALHIPCAAVSAFLGLATVALVPLFRIEGVGAATICFCGVAAFVASILSLLERFGPLRWLNMPLSFLLLFWFLGEPMSAPRWFAATIGFATFVLTLSSPLGLNLSPHFEND